MKKRTALVAAIVGLLSAAIPASMANAGEIVIQDPVHPDCDYVVYWDTNPLDAGSEGRCEG